ncbi:hypothetical protein K2173_002995 [Erythroxylum novogranatense]|uniref:Homeobox domain-containing protein n=1 Tax=Erythroxylum novogranatense TaxID=1862640 RepID=A0AAV8S8J6_9ROSI|nr:hypothetical protein K2173_002995 [Erythroxylum novogranatense]
MRIGKEEPSCMTEQIIDITSAVKELHGLSSQDLNKLLRDSENFTIDFHSEDGCTIKIDVEKLVSCLPLHLIAVLIKCGRDESRLRHVLCGLRLLHTFFDLAPRHTKLEQILLDELKVQEQLLDLVFYLLIVLSGFRLEDNFPSSMSLLHSALVACCLYLLTGCFSSHFQDLVPVLLAHPKVEMFMDAAFGAVNVAIKFLQAKLSSYDTVLHMESSPTAEQVINYMCQQCEASSQFLQLMCQQKVFRERLLRNKELCRNGGILFLAQSILKLSNAPPFLESSTVVAAISRLKAKVLSILLHLCEAESTSYLDEVASSPKSLNLAKSVALEVLELLKTAVSKDLKYRSTCPEKNFPMGLLRLNAMRLADIFSDDSNFRSYITTHFTTVLTAIFLLPHGDFLSIWCSSDNPPREEDATLEYDTFSATGWVLDTFSSLNESSKRNLEITLIPGNMPQATYSHQRTSLFVKVIANLHCFVPSICEEQERNLFLHSFLECMRMDPSKSLPGFYFPSGAQKATSVCRNLRSLLSHAESLIPNFLNEEDVQLLRVFFNQLQSLIIPADLEDNQTLEAQSAGGCSSPLLRKRRPDPIRNGDQKEETSENSTIQEDEQLNHKTEHMNQGDDLMREVKAKREIDKDVQNIETSGSDTSSTRGKTSVVQTGNGDFPKSSEQFKESNLKGVQGDEKFETVQFEEKQPRKRKRTIMNDYQMTVIERALIDEPDMHRNVASLQSWADKLSLHGSEVTSSQLKNWLNNRKARLARAGKDARVPMEVDSVTTERHGGPVRRHTRDSPVSPVDDNVPSSAQGLQSTARVNNVENALADFICVGGAETFSCKSGQYVVLVDETGEEVGRGKLHQVQGKWCGHSLEESGTFVVDITELKVERWLRLPYPSETTGISFDAAEAMIGVMRVLWDTNKIYKLRDH